MFNANDHIDLRQHIQIPNQYLVGLVKCRIIYDYDILSVSFSSYTIRDIESIAIAQADETSYPYKYHERSNLSAIRDQYRDFDEVIMVRDGLLTDAYYYNIVLKIDGDYLTPRLPLLKGIMRAKLIANQRVIPKDLTLEDLKVSDKIYLVNALTNLGQITLTPSNITF